MQGLLSPACTTRTPRDDLSQENKDALDGEPTSVARYPERERPFAANIRFDGGYLEAPLLRGNYPQSKRGTARKP